MQVTVPSSYTLYKTTYRHVGMFVSITKQRPLYQQENQAGAPLFVKNEDGYLVGLENGCESRSVGRYDTNDAVAGNLVTIDLNRYKTNKDWDIIVLNPKSASEHFWTAISTLKVIVGLGLTGAFVASTAAVCTMAYAQRTIVHFVPAVINAKVNGTMTTIPNPFNATAFHATCVNDTARNAADQYCVYEQRVGSWPHIIAAGIMIPFAFYFATQAIASVRSFVCRKEKQD